MADISFIICVNNELYFEECSYYINRLTVPAGMEVDIIGIREADSMCAAYNLGMESTDAKYKVYMHQDVFITNPDFINRIIDIFKKNEDVGMIGMVGGIGMPKTGVTYLAWNVGTVDAREPDMAYQLMCGYNINKDMVVDAVDGLLIATQYDVPWREDLFKGFDFYDVSQSFEMRRAGYKIVVPYQDRPWVVHVSGYAKLGKYKRDMDICRREYAEYLTENGGFEFVYNEEWEQLSLMLAGEVRRLIDKEDWEKVRGIIEEYHKRNMRNTELEIYATMSEIVQNEIKTYGKSTFFDRFEGVSDKYNYYMIVRMLLMRMEINAPVENYSELTERIRTGAISCEALIVIIMHTVLYKADVFYKIMQIYTQEKQQDKIDKIENLCSFFKNRKILQAYSKRTKKDNNL